MAAGNVQGQGRTWEDSDLDVRGVFDLLRRRLRLILAAVAIGLTVAGIAVLTLTPVYTASALIRVDPARENLLQPEMQNVSSASENARVESEAEILRSNAVLLAVVEEEGLVSDPEFGIRLGLRDWVLGLLGQGEAERPAGEAVLRNVLERLRGAITVERRGTTYLLSVSVRSESPQRAADLANAVARAYVEDQVRSKIDSVLAAGAVLEARMQLARENILRSEEEFDAFVSAHIDQLAARPGSAVATLRADLESILSEREQTEALVQALDDALARRDWSTLGARLGSDALAELERQRQALAAGLETAAPDSPVAIGLRAERAEIERRLAAEVLRALGDLRATIAGLDERAGRMRQQMRSEVFSSDLPLDVLTRLYELQQSADLARSQYQTLLARTGDLRIQADSQLADSRIVSAALPPAGPSFPDARLILVLGGLAGLGLGIALAVVYENFLGGFTSESQVGLVTRQPVLGAVPLQRLPAGMASPADMLVSAPMSQVSEAIRRVRAGLGRYLRGLDGWREGEAASIGAVLMVSSSVPGEGKTAIALALGRTYAQAGVKTLVIDCDLRRPAIHKSLGMDSDVGLLDYLDGRADSDALSAIIQRDEATGLSILPGSRPSETPTDQLITSTAFSRLVRAATRSFDVVILDTPPLLPVVDSLYLARYADAVLFIVRWSATAQSEVRSALAQLEQARRPEVPVLMLLNQVVKGRNRYGRTYAGYYNE